MSIVCVLIVALGHLAAHGSWGGLSFFLSNLALIQNLTWQGSIIGPLWSLPYEVQMYVVLPFIYLLARKKNALPMLIGLWILSAITGNVLRNSDPRYFLEQFKYNYFPLIWFMPTFLGGVFAFSLSKQKHLNIPGYYWPLLVVGILAGFEYFHPTHEEWLMGLLGFAIPQFSEIRSRWAQYISHTVAKYSYGVYLVNLPLIALFFKYFAHLHPVLRWAGFFSSMVVLSVAGYHLVEKPMINLGHRVARRLLRTPQKTQVEKTAAPLWAEELETSSTLPM